MKYFLMLICCLMVCSFISLATLEDFGSPDRFATSLIGFLVAAAMSIALNFILVFNK